MDTRNVEMTHGYACPSRTFPVASDTAAPAASIPVSTTAFTAANFTNSTVETLLAGNNTRIYSSVAAAVTTSQRNTPQVTPPRQRRCRGRGSYTISKYS